MNPDTASAPSKAASGLGERIIPLVVASSLFMDLMDSSALATALPTLAQHFHVRVVDLKLALTAYLVTAAILVPASGWLANRFGAKRVFIGAMALFTLGSIFCGLSANVPQLVAARIVQGVGGSMMTPVGRSIVVASVARESLVRAMSWFTIPAIVAPLAGPPLAGVILATASWRWIFLINVPVGIFGVAAVIKLLPRMARIAQGRFDRSGYLLAAGTIVLSMALIETGGLEGGPLWLRGLTAASAALAAAAFVAHVLKRADPIIDLRLLGRASLRVSLLSTWLQRITVGAIAFLLPLQLQIGLRHSALISSQVLVAMAVGSMTSRFLAPWAIERFGFRRAMIALGLQTLCLTTAPAWFAPGTPILAMAALMGALSVGRSAFFMAANTLIYADVEGAEVGHASVLSAVAQQLSLGIGVNLAAMLLELGGGSAQTASAFAPAYLALAAPVAASLLIVGQLSNDAGQRIVRRAVG